MSVTAQRRKYTQVVLQHTDPLIHAEAEVIHPVLFGKASTPRPPGQHSQPRNGPLPIEFRCQNAVRTKATRTQFTSQHTHRTHEIFGRMRRLDQLINKRANAAVPAAPAHTSRPRSSFPDGSGASASKSGVSRTMQPSVVGNINSRTRSASAGSALCWGRNSRSTRNPDLVKAVTSDRFQFGIDAA